MDILVSIVVWAALAFILLFALYVISRVISSAIINMEIKHLKEFLNYLRQNKDRKGGH